MDYDDKFIGVHWLTWATVVGMALRKTRLEKGIDLDDIQYHTNIPLHYLEAIERGHFKDLPGGLITRSYIRQFAKAVGFYEGNIEEFIEALQKAALSSNTSTPIAVVQQPTVVKKIRPPRFAEYLLYFFLTKSERVNLIGDTEEEYNEVLDKFGRGKANAWYYKQVFDSLYPLIRRSLGKFGAVVWAAKHADKITDLFHRYIK